MRFRNIIGIFRTYDFAQAIPNIRTYGLGTFIRNAVVEILGRDPFNNSNMQFKSAKRYKALAKLEKNFLPLSFKKTESPVVSIIIPVYNNFLYTYNCLKSIVEVTEGVEYEVIIVDNASTDETVKLQELIANIVVIQNSENQGFVDACNAGAQKARGKYVLFLNNDTKVLDGWLAAMLAATESDNTIGAVGAKLIFPDGVLQEAGGIVWSDEESFAWNYGRGKDPDNYEFNYLRDVDYCSGACLLVHKDLFEKAGFFDRRYAPAFCEDTDLAFSIRELGYRVVYQPLAEIIHFEGRTAGTDTSQGLKKYQVINREKFYAKWKNVLEKENFKGGEKVPLARDRSQTRKTVLFIDHYVPTHDKDAGSLAAFLYLKLYIELGYRVIFLPDNYLKLEPYSTELQQMGVEVLYGAVSFDQWIALNGQYIDYVWTFRPTISIKYIDALKKFTTAKILYNVVDLHYLREFRRYEVERDESIKKEAKTWQELEFKLFEGSDVVLTYSDKEAKIISDEFPDKDVKVIPLFFYDEIPVEKEKILSFDERRDIVFLGGFNHPPNVDAVEYFVNDIFSLVKERLPQVKFYIIGSNPPDRIVELTSEDVVVTGFVEDLSDIFNGIRLCVAPLRFGAGVKGKILTSLSFGVPVITTDVGNEGINLTDGVNCMLAETPEKFAGYVVDLYTNKELWERLSTGSVEFLKANFSKSFAKAIIQEFSK